MKFKELRKLGKEELIRIAFDRLEEQGYRKYGISRELFNDTRVYITPKDIEVNIQNTFRYFPQNSQFLNDLVIWLISGQVAYDTHSNPEGFDSSWFDFPPVFKETKESKEAISRVKEKLGISEQPKQKNNKLPYQSVIIKDNVDYWDVEIDTKSTGGWFKLNKKTGEKFDEHHKHKAITKGEKRNEIFY